MFLFFERRKEILLLLLLFFENLLEFVFCLLNILKTKNVKVHISHFKLKKYFNKQGKKRIIIRRLTTPSNQVIHIPQK